MDEGNQSRFFQSLATSNNPQCQEVLTKIGGYGTGAPRSTKKKYKINKIKNKNENKDEEEEEVQQEEHNEKTFEVFMTIVDANKIYTDQTGRFPVTSSKGTKYLCIAYEYDSNAILAKPMKGRKGSDILMAYKEILKYLEMRGF